MSDNKSTYVRPESLIADLRQANDTLEAAKVEVRRIHAAIAALEDDLKAALNVQLVAASYFESSRRAFIEQTSSVPGATA